jgi:putative nucleotidyltransferase with HDIG domain
MHSFFARAVSLFRRVFSSLLSVIKSIGDFIWRNVIQNQVARAWLLGVVVFAVLVSLFYISLIPKQLNVEIGERSTIDYEAPRGIENRYRTEQLREKASEAAYRAAVNDPDYYIIANTAAATAKQKMTALFEQVDWRREENEELNASDTPVTDALIQRQAREIQSRLADRVQVVISEQPLITLLKLDEEHYQTVRKHIETIYPGMMTSERISQEAILDPDSIIAQHLPESLSSADRNLVRNILEKLMFINLTLDRERVLLAQENAKREVMPVYVTRGTAILMQGKEITEEDMTLLEDLGVLNSGASRFLMFLSSILLVVLVVGLIAIYLYIFNRDLLMSTGSLMLIGVIFLAVNTAAVAIGYLPGAWAGYIIPVPMGAMLLAILINRQVALSVSAIISILAGIVVGYQLQPALALLAGSWAAVFSLAKVSQRSNLTRAGVVAASVSFLATAILGVLSGGPNNTSILQRSLLSFANGIVSSILTIGLLPFLENTFGVTSAIRLLELSNPNQVLLRRLLVEAPGTYHHSIMVGNLAEAAAESVNANSLLVRVAAYYHDIGKIKRPYFFVENQIGQDNPHEKLAPTLSTLIITSHVKEGVELAAESKLPKQVIDLIEQHHGTDLVRYFYARAAENENSDRDRLRESDFRYAGPKPQSKEAAVLMLADSVEAACRALVKPTPARIEAMIERIIKERLDEGQLSECDITMKELRTLASSFARVLSGIFHSRIEYPENVVKEFEKKRAGNNAAAH